MEPEKQLPAARSSRVRLYAIGTVVVLATLAIGGWKYLEHQKDQASRATLLTPIKTVSIYATSLMDVQSKPSEITFAEFFRKTESALNELDKMSIQARSSASQENPYLAPSLAYITNAADLLRSVDGKMRALVELDAVTTRGNRVMAMSPPQSAYARELQVEQLKSVQEEYHKALDQIASTNAASLRHSKTLHERQPWVAATFGQDASVPEATFAAFDAEFSKTTKK